jgi:TusA-related sulfurtransferase
MGFILLFVMLVACPVGFLSINKKEEDLAVGSVLSVISKVSVACAYEEILQATAC